MNIATSRVRTAGCRYTQSACSTELDNSSQGAAGTLLSRQLQVLKQAGKRPNVAIQKEEKCRLSAWGSSPPLHGWVPLRTSIFHSCARGSAMSCAIARAFRPGSAPSPWLYRTPWLMLMFLLACNQLGARSPITHDSVMDHDIVRSQFHACTSTLDCRVGPNRRVPQPRGWALAAAAAARSTGSTNDGQ